MVGTTYLETTSIEYQQTTSMDVYIVVITDMYYTLKYYLKWPIIEVPFTLRHLPYYY